MCIRDRNVIVAMAVRLSVTEAWLIAASRVPHVLEVVGDVHGVARAHHDLPAGQILFDLAGQAGDVPGENQLLVADLVLDARALDRLGDLLGVELAGRPGGEHRQAVAVGDEPVSYTHLTLPTILR